MSFNSNFYLIRRATASTPLWLAPDTSVQKEAHDYLCVQAERRLAWGNKKWLTGWYSGPKIKDQQCHVLGPKISLNTNLGPQQPQAKWVNCVLQACNVTWHPPFVRVPPRWVARNRFGRLTVGRLIRSWPWVLCKPRALFKCELWMAVLWDHRWHWNNGQIHDTDKTDLRRGANDEAYGCSVTSTSCHLHGLTLRHIVDFKGRQCTFFSILFSNINNFSANDGVQSCTSTLNNGIKTNKSLF